VLEAGEDVATEDHGVGPRVGSVPGCCLRVMAGVGLASFAGGLATVDGVLAVGAQRCEPGQSGMIRAGAVGEVAVLAPLLGRFQLRPRMWCMGVMLPDR
jgi:hypothetical protein